MKKLPSLENASIRSRFVVSIIIMLLPIFVLTIIFFYNHKKVVRSLDEVVEESRDEMHPTMLLQNLILQSAMPVHDYLIFGDIIEHETFRKGSASIDHEFTRAFEAPFNLTEERELIRSAHLEWLEIKKLAERIFTLPQDTDNRTYLTLMKQFDEHIYRANDLFNQNHQLIVHEMEGLLGETQRIKKHLFLYMLTAFILGLGAAVVASIKLPRSILSPLNILGRATEQLARGDLGSRVSFESEDELGKLARSFNIMAARLENSQAALEELATLDPLTDVNNRREFYRRLHEEVERSHRYDRVFSLFIMDLDNFKEINDTYGHPAGDRVLKAIAGVVKKAVRPVDILARYGGDEFALILPETPLQKALALAERIRRAVEAHMILLAAGKKVSLTLSIGAADFPKDGKTADKIISAADRYLYESKRSGRNRVYYASS